MKKLLATILLIALTLLTFASCGKTDEPPANDNTKMRIGYLNGPTGVGMAKMINDYGTENDKYSFKSYQADQSAAMGELLTNKIDAICLPTNVAAKHFKAQNSNCTVVAINTLNTLFFISDDSVEITALADLEGKTVYTCSNGTPKIILDVLLAKANLADKVTAATEINGQNIVTPDDLRAQIVKGAVPIAFAPEPIVSASAAARQGAGKTAYSVDINCDTAWNQHFDAPIAMGCLVVNKTFAKEHPTVISDFLKEYKNSIDYVTSPENASSAANYIVNAGILPNQKVATSALKNLGNSITLITGSEMKTTLEAFYAAIGEPSPGTLFYYES